MCSTVFREGRNFSVSQKRDMNAHFCERGKYGRMRDENERTTTGGTGPNEAGEREEESAVVNVVEVASLCCMLGVSVSCYSKLAWWFYI